MYKFGQASKQRLVTCHSDLQVISNDLITRVDFSIIYGHRTKGAQEIAVMKGYSKTHWPDSKHNHYPSNAIDIAPYPIDWKDEKRFCVLAGRFLDTAERLLGEGMITHEIRWGGDWDRDTSTTDQNFNDYCHFELIK